MTLARDVLDTIDSVDAPRRLGKQREDGPDSMFDVDPEKAAKYEKIFRKGATIDASHIDGSDDEGAWLVNNNIMFHAPADAIEELHIFNYQDTMVGTNPGKGLGGWPVISKQGSLIKVESAYGWDKEDYVLCKHVVVETMH